LDWSVLTDLGRGAIQWLTNEWIGLEPAGHLLVLHYVSSTIVVIYLRLVNRSRDRARRRALIA
jgi:hypothetical protein